MGNPVRSGSWQDRLDYPYPVYRGNWRGIGPDLTDFCPGASGGDCFGFTLQPRRLTPLRTRSCQWASSWGRRSSPSRAGIPEPGHCVFLRLPQPPPVLSSGRADQPVERQRRGDSCRRDPTPESRSLSGQHHFWERSGSGGASPAGGRCPLSNGRPLPDRKWCFHPSDRCGTRYLRNAPVRSWGDRRNNRPYPAANGRSPPSRNRPAGPEAIDRRPPPTGSLSWNRFHTYEGESVQHETTAPNQLSFPAAAVSPPLPPATSVPDVPRRPVPALRSEEHTSERQSRESLVCR